MSEVAEKALLRLVACGSVDDGKSTLLGRLMIDTGQTPSDELALARDAPAHLFDGLEAEREQGITIDVAYRYFETERCKFIVADAPGHVQYTRNLVTGASVSQAAVILVDAERGIQPQTFRHAWIARLLGVRDIVLAVNKMDRIGFDGDRFTRIAAEFCGRFGTHPAVPVVALTGENVANRSRAMPFYEGPPLLELLEEIADRRLLPTAIEPLRMPVQGSLLAPDGRRFATGRIESGTIKVGQAVAIVPAGVKSEVAEILLGPEPLREAVCGQSIAVRLADEVDCWRGEMICEPEDQPDRADQFEATLIWMGDAAMLPGRQYRLRIGTQEALATLEPPCHVLDFATLAPRAAPTLELNDIGLVRFWTDRPIVYEPFAVRPDGGGLILIDRISNDTIGAGLIRCAIKRGRDLHAAYSGTSPAQRAAKMGQAPVLIWLTGISGAGKSTIANCLEQKLHALGRHTYILDGDNLRLGLNRDLGFSDADRAENIRRAGEVAKLMLDAGLIVIAAFISPFRAEREAIRAALPMGRFLEVHVHVELAEAKRRDPKGLYLKAAQGDLPDLTGVGSRYEAPIRPEVFVDTCRLSPEEAADAIWRRCIEVLAETEVHPVDSHVKGFVSPAASPGRP
jgi:bifunctional enzyme CysN/CysC